MTDQEIIIYDLLYDYKNEVDGISTQDATNIIMKEIEKVKTRPAWRIVGELEAKIEELEEYAQHKPECTFGKTKYYNNKVCKVGEERSKKITKCSCGLNKLLK
jgi:hypothetical protein